MGLSSESRWVASNWTFFLLFCSFTLINRDKGAVCNFGLWLKIDLQHPRYMLNWTYTFNEVIFQGLSWMLDLQLCHLTKLSLTTADSLPSLSLWLPPQSACQSSYYPHSQTRSKILELCCLRLCFAPYPEWVFLAEFHCLRFGGTDTHPSCLRLVCELF